MLKITDRRFQYVNAASTDIRKTFKRILAEQKRQAADNKTVVPMRKAAK